MNLAEEYRAQLAWRDWPRALDALGPVEDARVLDLGCAAGDVAALLAARGARVVGYDANPELAAAARARGIPRAEFREGDLRALPETPERFEGIWCSFAAAYLADLAGALASWRARLVPGGWIALVEVDDLFGHEPLAARWRELLDAYADEARAAGRHDFRTGRTLAARLAEAGFHSVRTLELADRELAFDGPAAPDVLAAWDARLARMRLLQERAGAAFPALRADFLACLAHPEHRARARVVCALAVRG